ncbi:Rrf2 family transcriptional regulator [Shouchella shacheensis]|uniref:Rrf2 family transcriptional regulator n=1 Tax=Shouchella shacheensis TaxID=1649580 RepID=UPI00074015BB|nr:Rrf2 family transcriptional regulator [Shouchella shacheensis]
MQLTSYTDYSLRTLLYVGSLPEEKRAQVKDIANAYHLSLNHLQKIVHDLGKKELLETVRGRNGGMKLAKSPEEINIGELIRMLEDLELVECFSKDGGCLISGSCRLQSVLYEAREAFLQVLDRYTLADLLQNKDDLYDLFKKGTSI